jgi:hypothetical protein
MRVLPPDGAPRGSLKWLRIAISERPGALSFDDGGPVTWLSPLASDGFAEYRDAAFLKRLGIDRLAAALAAFWPARGGPQWDALGTRGDQVILVEAKAHIGEFFGSPCLASAASRRVIEAAFAETQAALGAKPRAPWTDCYYQYANRLAHLHFLRAQGVDARLLFVGFIGDKGMKGPESAAEWSVAYRSADYALGLPGRHRLSPFVHHVCPDVAAPLQ